ncbi:MAG: AI-2E family transporter [Weeksellaceae bacterium]|nr:AI-2E family transporter [Weeksellaceae bacterium]
MSWFYKLLGLKNVPTDDEKVLDAEIEAKTSDTLLNIPFYVKWPLILLGLFLAFYILYLAQSTLKPLAFGILLAIVLNPVYNRLLLWGWPKFLALISCLLLALGVLFGLAYFLYSQIASFWQMQEEFAEGLEEVSEKLRSWLNENLGLDVPELSEFDFKSEAANYMHYLGDALSMTSTVLFSLFLMMVYTMFVLSYKPLLLNFIYEVTDNKYSEKVKKSVNEVKVAIQSYMVGLIIEMVLITAILYGVYLLLGIKHALLLAFIAAVLNFIPYIGSAIAMFFPIFIYLITGDGSMSTIIWIVVLYNVVQAIDKYVIVPTVVASKVKLNAFFTVLAVFLGGSIWGLSGMFLSIPFMGVMKLIFDQIPSMRPYGKVLGDDTSPENLSIDHRHTRVLRKKT